MEQLEPRILYSGAPVAAQSDAPVEASPAVEPAPVPGAGEAPAEGAVVPVSSGEATAPVSSDESTTKDGANGPNAGDGKEVQAQAGGIKIDPLATDALPVATGQTDVPADQMVFVFQPEDPGSAQKLEQLAAAAEQRWIASGLSEAQTSTLAQIQYHIASLDGVILGYAEGMNIFIDADAAERGWFIDSTPMDDEEAGFTGVDLVSVLSHEIGHILGLDHAEETAGADVMNDAFVTGERRIIVDGQAKAAVAGSSEGAHYAHMAATLTQVTVTDQASWDSQVGSLTAGHEVVFSGAGGSIAIIGDVTLGALHFQSGNFTLSGGEITIAGVGGSIQSDVDATINSVIEGNGDLTKTGAGTLSLGGNNTYSGATRVISGTLQVDAGTISATNSVHIEAGNFQIISGGAVTVTNAVTNGAGAGSLLVDNGTMTVGNGLDVDTLRVGLNGGTSQLTTTSGVVRVGNGTERLHIGRTETANNNTRGTVDFSGASTVTINVSEVYLGTTLSVANPGSSIGGLTLSSTGANLVSADAITIGDSPSAGNTSTPSVIGLGQNNTFNVDTFTIGGQKSRGTVTIASGGTLELSGNVNAGTDLDIGFNVTGNTGTISIGLLDLSGGIFNATLDAVRLGRHSIGSGSGTGTITFDAGTVTANTVELGSGNLNSTGTINQRGGTFTVANGVSESRTSTLNIEAGDFVVTSGGLEVDNLTVGYADLDDIGTGTNTGRLTVSGGAVSIGDGVANDLRIGYNTGNNNTVPIAIGIVNFTQADSVTINVDDIFIGSLLATGGVGTRGDLDLSNVGNNVITADQIIIGDCPSPGNQSANSTLTFGSMLNTVDVDTFDVGARKGRGTVDIALGGTLNLSGNLNANDEADLRVGINDAANTGTVTTGVFDMSNGVFNATLDEIILGRHASTSGGPGSGDGTLTFDEGTVTARSVLLADPAPTSTAPQNTDGVLNLGGGTLNIQGGNITEGGGTEKFNFTDGVLKDVNIIGFNFTQQGGTLQIGADASADSTTVDGNFTASGGTIEFDVLGTAGAGVAGGHDTIVVDNSAGNGVVTLGGVLTLNVNPGNGIATGTEIVLIDNDGTADAVSGTFTGLAEGATVTVGGNSFIVSYAGGDGNDVTLTALNDAPVANADTNSANEAGGLNNADKTAGGDGSTLSGTSGNVLGHVGATAGDAADGDADPDDGTLSPDTVIAGEVVVSGISYTGGGTPVGAQAGGVVTGATAVDGQYGTLTINPDGTYSYALNDAASDTIGAGESQTDEFTYTVSDFGSPGLMAGFVAGSNNTSGVNQGNLGTSSGPNAFWANAGARDADREAAWGDPLNKTIVYTGQIYLAAGDTHFLMMSDDTSHLKIDGVAVISAAGWNTADAGTFTNSTGAAGWFDVEIRTGNGAGGYGFFNQSAAGEPSWAGIESGFLMKSGGAASTDPNDAGWDHPEDPGDGSLFRNRIGTSTATLTITVNGSNDAPLITIDAGDSAAANLAETDSGLVTTGTLSIEDVDTSDTVSATVSSVVVTGDDNSIGNAALLAMLTAGTNPVISNTATTADITWTFDSGSEAFNYLSAGESLVLEYTITATDDAGTPLSDAQTVTITIRGVNDAPELSGVAITSENEATQTTLSGTIIDADFNGDGYTITVDWADGNDPGLKVYELADLAAADGTYNDVTGAFTLFHTYADDDPTATASDAVTVRVQVWETLGYKLEALYNFDAGDATDGTANGNDGTISGTGITYTTGDAPAVLNGGGVANGEDSGYINVAHSASLANIDDQLTVSFWIKAELADNDAWFRVMRKGNEGNDGTASWIINRTSTTDEVNLRTDTFPDDGLTGKHNYNQHYNSGSSVLDGNWHHVTYVLDAGDSREYVDGVLNHTQTYLHGDGLFNTDALQLMGRSSSDGIFGAMDDIALYSRALSAAEVAELASSPVPTNVSSQIVQVVTTVSDVAPTVSLTAPAGISENGTATLAGTISDVGTLDTFTLDLNWGDASSPDNTQSFALGTAVLTKAVDGIDWNPVTRVFSVDHKYLDDNPTGTASDSYTIGVTVTDDDTLVGTGSTTVAVSNVAPVITVGALDSAAETVVETDAALSVSGTLTVSDVGSLDTTAATVNSTVVISGGSGSLTSADVLPMLTLSNATTGTVGWTFDSSSKPESFDFLAAGETLTLTYTVTVTDDDTGTDTQTIAITITGTNDAPVANDDRYYFDEDNNSTIVGNGNVANPGLFGAQLLYETTGFTNFDNADNYTTDNSASIAAGSFDRVAYYLELDGFWVWVSMDAFNTDANLVGVPADNSGIVENGTVVTNLTIESNHPNVASRTISRGIIEFWASNYGPSGGGQFGSSDGLFDWKDSGGTTAAGHGSFQVADITPGAEQMIFSVTGSGIGIGSQPTGNPDWTFGPNSYSVRNLQVWVGGGQSLLANDVDLDIDGNAPDDAVTVVSAQGANLVAGSVTVTSDKGASVVVNDDGTFSYDSSASAEIQALSVNEVTTDTFTYTISDGTATSTATATITVNGRNDAPVANDDTGYATTEDTVLTITAPTAPVGNGNVVNAGISGAKLLYETVGFTNFDNADNYTTDNSASIATGSFERVGYYLELDSYFVWVSMDAFNSDASLVGVPADNSGIVQNGTVVTNLKIESNHPNVASRTIPTGIIEFWASNYGPSGGGQFGSSDGLFDWKDSGGTTAAGHGSFQVADITPGAEVMIFSITGGAMGMGNQPGGGDSPDWTFNRSGLGGSYTVRNLQVWVGGRPDLLANDSDIDVNGNAPDDSLTVIAAQNMALAAGTVTITSDKGASVTVNADGTFSYDPNGQFEYLAVGESTQDTFSYTISDGNGGTSTATATVTVNGVNDAPVAVDDGTFGSVWQLGQDNGSSGEFERESGGSQPAPGSATARDNDYYFAGTYGIGTVAVDEAINDGIPDNSGALVGFERALTGGDPTTRIHFNLAADQLDNELRVVIDNVSNGASGLANGPYEFEVLFNGHLVYTGAITTTGGSVHTTPAFTAASVGGVTGENIITITKTDSNGGWMSFDRITLESKAVFTTNEDTTLTVSAAEGVLTNDRDVDIDGNAPDDVITVTSHDAHSAAGGVVTVNPDGSFNYDPFGRFDYLAAGESATDTFNYTITDSQGATSSATVTVKVTGANDDPVAVDDGALAEIWRIGIDNGGSGEFEQEGGVNAAPGDPNLRDDDYYFAGEYGGTIGTVVETESINDGIGGSSRVYGFERAFVNGGADSRIHFNLDPGQLNDDFVFSVDFSGLGGSNTGGHDIRILFNGVEIHSETVTAAKLVTTAAVSGTSVGAITGDNVITIERSDDRGGYILMDYLALSAVQVHATDQDTVLTVGVAEGVLSNDSDVDTTNTITVTSFDSTSAGGATVIVNADGSFTYDPGGQFDYLAAGATTTDTFTYTITDSDGGSDTATVTITITGTNDSPVITSAGQSGAITETVDNSGGTDADPAPATGTITFNDVDLSDTHTATVLPGASVTGGTATLTAAQAAALLDNLSLGAVQEDTPGDGSGAVGWTYTVANAEIDFLAAGETVEVTHTVAIGDSGVILNGDFSADAADFATYPGYISNPNNPGGISGWTHTGQVGINPVAAPDGRAPFANNGDNATPVVFIQGSGSISQTVSGLVVGQTYALVFDYNERATGGSTTVTATIAGATFTDADNAPVGGANPYRQAVLRFIATATSETLTISGASNGGDQTTLIDNVRIDVTQDVVVTITGTNDAPVITSSAQTGAITETIDNPGGTDTDPAAATGTITFDDADLADRHTVEILPGASVTGGTATLTATQQAALLDNLNLGAVLDGIPVLGSGQVGWTYTVPNSEIDFLATGKTVEVTHTVVITDSAVVVNGDFSANAADFDTYPGYISNANNPSAISGWTHVGSVGLNPVAAPDGRAPFANNGDNSTAVAFIQRDGSISQTVSGLVAGQTYALMFDYNERAGGGAPDSTTVTATIAGSTFTDADNSPVGGSNPYRQAVLLFTATASSETLTISGATNGGDQTTLIDNVRIGLTQDVVVTITGANDAPVANPDTAAANENGPAISIDVLANDTDVDNGATLSIQDYSEVTVADYRNDYQNAAQGTVADFRAVDGSGWQYFWNAPSDWDAGDVPGQYDPADGPITDISSFRHLISSGSQWTSDGDTDGTNSNPDRYVRLGSTNGHPGAGPNDAHSEVDRFAITAYTVAADGNYGIADSFISRGSTNGDGDIVHVYVNDTFKGSTVVAPGGNVDFDQMLGGLSAGDTIYVAVGTNGTAGSDGFSWDFSIKQYGGALLQNTKGVVTTDGSKITYDPAGNFEYLAAGETTTDTFTYRITDEQGATDEATVTVTITGSNDAPVITVENDDSDEATLTETDAGLSTAGTLSVADIDLTNIVTPSVTGLVVSGTGAANIDASLTNAVLQGMLTVAPNPVIDGTADEGTLTWTFDSSGESFDELAVGETLVLQYTVQVEDSSGATDTRVVTITIVGSNDAPVVNISATDVNEGQSTLLTGDFTDPDLSDPHTITIAWGDANSLPDSVFALPRISEIDLGVQNTFTSTGADSTTVLTITSVDKITGKVEFTVAHRYLDDGVSGSLFEDGENCTPSDVAKISVVVDDPTTASGSGSEYADTLLAEGANLTGYWRFDTASGALVDASGNSHTLTAQGDATTGAGSAVPPFGDAASFDGNADLFATGATAGELGFTGDFTASAWIFINPNDPTALVGDNTILGTDTTGANNGLHLVIRDGRPHFGFFANDMSGVQTLNAGEWYHVTYRFTQATGEQALFVNGVLDRATTGHASFVGAANEVKIGRWRNSNAHSFNGNLDEVSVISRSLTNEEVLALAMTNAAATTITVSNVAPTLTLGNASVDENGSAVMSGTITDPGLLDSHLAVVDWGDPNNIADATFDIGAVLTANAAAGTTVNNLAPGAVLMSSTDDSVLTITSTQAELDAGIIKFTLSRQVLDDGLSATPFASGANGTTTDTFTVTMRLVDDDQPSLESLLAGDADLNGLWRMEEAGGTAAAANDDQVWDASGNDGHGTLSNGATASGTLVLDGVNDYLAVGTVGELGLNGSFTAIATINLTDLAGDQTVFGTNRSVANQGLHLVVRSGKLHFGFHSNDTGSSVVLSTGQDYQVTFRYDAVARTQTIFLDGVQIAQGVNKNAFAGPAGDVVQIGKWRADTEFTGQIDDAAIIGRAMTNEEIAALHNCVVAPVVATATLTVNNLAPLLRLDAVSPINENGTATVTGTITDAGRLDSHEVTINWGDVNDTTDAVFDLGALLAVDTIDGTTSANLSTGTIVAANGDILTITSVNPASGEIGFSVTHRYYDDGPTGTFGDDVTISVTVADDDTASVTETAVLHINDVASTVTLHAPAAVTENSTATPTLTGSYTDPGLLDTQTLSINWGDPNDTELVTFDINKAIKAVTDSTAGTLADLLMVNDTFTGSDGSVMRITGIDDTTGKVDFEVTHVYLDDGLSESTWNPATAAGNRTPGDLSTITVTIADDDSTTAGTLAQWNFPVAGGFGTETGAGFDASAVATGLAAGSVADTSGNITIGAVALTYPNPVMQVSPGNGSTSVAEAVAADRYFEFTVTPDAGMQLDLSKLSFDAGRGGSSTARGWGIATSVDNFATVIDSSEPGHVAAQRPGMTAFSVDLSAAQYQDLTGPVTFRIYVYSPNSGNTVEFDNFNLEGVVEAQSFTTTVMVNNLVPTVALDPVAGINEAGIATITGSAADVGTLDSHQITINWGDPNDATDSIFDLGAVRLVNTTDGSTSANPLMEVGDTYNSTSGDGTVLTILSVAADGSFTFEVTGHQFIDDHVPGTGADVYTVTATITDDDSGVGLGTETITVTNLPPVPQPDFYTTDEDSVLVISAPVSGVLGNDNDVANANGPLTAPIHDPLSILSIDTAGTIGVVTMNPDGTFIYNPNGRFEYLGSGQTATDTFTYTVTDDDGGTATGTVTITINGRNDAPIINNNADAGHAVTVAGGTGGQIIAPNITITDVDSPNLVSATIQICAGYVPGQDILLVRGDLPGGISVSGWDPATGTLTLRGAASVALYQQALRQITFVNTSGQSVSGMRTICFVVNDGENVSNTGYQLVNVVPGAVTENGSDPAAEGGRGGDSAEAGDPSGDGLQLDPPPGTFNGISLQGLLNSFRDLRQPKLFAGFRFDSDPSAGRFGNSMFIDGADPVEIDNEPLLTLTPYFAGTATPGSAITVLIRDEVGQPIAVRTVYADLAGNWVAPFLGVTLENELYTVEITEALSLWSGSSGDGNPAMAFSFNGAAPGSSVVNVVPGVGQIFGSVLDAISIEELVRELTTR